MRNKICNQIIMVVFLCILLMFGLGGCDASGFNLGAPKNVKYDGSMITWDAVENAEKYIVKVNDGAEITANTNSFGYAANGTQFTFTVKGDSSSSKII